MISETCRRLRLHLLPFLGTRNRRVRPSCPTFNLPVVFTRERSTLCVTRTSRRCASRYVDGRRPNSTTYGKNPQFDFCSLDTTVDSSYISEEGVDNVQGHPCCLVSDWRDGRSDLPDFLFSASHRLPKESRERDWEPPRTIVHRLFPTL